MTLPNFLLIGAPKNGTTSLYTYLQQHPQIYMSPNKEPHFFAFEGHPLDFRGPGDEKAWLTQYSVTNLEEYQALFASAEGETALGEASTMYLYLPETPQRIRAYVPDAKLIAILRHPIDRAFSHFLHLRRDGREWLTDFSEALRQEKKRISKNYSPAWHYLSVGCYWEQIQRYYQTFNPEQIKIYLYEDWTSNPARVIEEIFDFLEVDSSFTPDMSKRENISSLTYKNPKFQKFLTQPNSLKSFLRNIIPAKIRKPMAAKAYRKNFTPETLKLTPEMRHQWLPVVREDILKLQDLIERDLSHWLKV